MKLNKKVLLYSGAALAGVATISGLVAGKINFKYKPSIWNYKSYISDENLRVIDKNFDYKQFDTISQFSNALINNKAVAGIGSDFFAFNLVKNNHIQKIDYSKLFGVPELKDFNTLQKFMQLILKPEIWNHFNNKYYTKALNEISKNKSQDQYLWEYMFPYYSQDAVLAYNIKKVNIPEKYKLEDGSANFDLIYSDMNLTGDKNSMVNLLKMLNFIGYKEIIWTDAVRDNMLYGSAYTRLQNGSSTDKNYTGNVTFDNYKNQIDSFTNLIKDGTSNDVKDNQKITFEGDGLQIVNTLLDPTRFDITSSLMYNGDAIDAYYGEDNFESVGDGAIRVVKFKNNLLLVDGLVVAATNNDETNELIYDTLRNSWIKNVGNIYTQYKDLLAKNLISDSDSVETQQKVLTESAVADYWKDFRNIDFESFAEDNDFEQSAATETLDKYYSMLNLALVENKDKFNSFYEMQDDPDADFEEKINPYPSIFLSYLKDNKDELLDKIVSAYKDNSLKDLLEEQDNFEDKYLVNLVNENYEDLTSEDYYPTSTEDSELKESLSQFLANALAFIDISEDQYSDLLTEKYLNLNNYDHINYDPTQNIDYEFIKRNYFASALDGQDENALNIYQIVKTDEVDYKGIEPISQDLQSLVDSYYYNRTKS